MSSKREANKLVKIAAIMLIFESAILGTMIGVIIWLA
jgi:hypothetical protein